MDWVGETRWAVSGSAWLVLELIGFRLLKGPWAKATILGLRE